jgi:hypothetical protein
MKKFSTLLALLSLLLLSAAACVESSKSETPLSPAVAGPLPGVNITAPAPIQPAAGSKLPTDQQPVTLVVNNASSSGVRPLVYRFEVATDAGFGSIVFSRDGVTSGGGQTALRLPDALSPDRSYFWRARADDGANTGPFSAAVAFSIFTPVLFQPPTLVAPTGDMTVSSLKPRFTFNNALRSGPATPVSYLGEISDTPTFATAVSIPIPEGSGGVTNYDPPTNLPANTQLFWRVRAGDANTLGPWSSVQSFRTPAAPPPPPPPPPPGGGGDWQSCGSLVNDPPALVRCVHATILPTNTETAFEVTKRVAWLMRGGGAGLLIKNGGENIVGWRGLSFSASRICYPDGHIWKVLSDVGPGGANGPAWQDNDFVDRSLYVPAIDPSLP